MKKLKKLSVLLLLSLIIPGYIQGATNNKEIENSNSDSNISEISSTNPSSESGKDSGFSLLDAARKKHYSIFVGYTGNFKNSDRDVEKNNKYNNIIELGAAYTDQTSSKLGYSIYAGSDILFNSSHFLVGPKVGANVNYSIVMLGSEMIMYTDANFAKVYYRPYVGVGVGPLKISAGYNIGLGNKGTFKEEVNSFTVGVTIPIFWGN